MKESKRRLDEELWTECQANAAYEAYRARGVRVCPMKCVWSW